MICWIKVQFNWKSLRSKKIFRVRKTSIKYMKAFTLNDFKYLFKQLNRAFYYYYFLYVGFITKIFPKPSLRSNKLSNIWIKSLLGWWSVQITVIPCLLSWRKSLTTWWARYESRPVVGSSRKIIAGLTTIPQATVKRFFSPPEILFLLSAFPMS